MNGDERQFTDAIRRHLDVGVAQLRPGVAYRLQHARASALARLGETAQAASGGDLIGAHGLASAGGPDLSGPGEPRGSEWLRKRRWLAVALVAAALIGYQQWSAWQEAQALEDLDIQILSSELPIDAYLDRGFQLWLKTSQPLD